MLRTIVRFFRDKRRATHSISGARKTDTASASRSPSVQASSAPRMERTVREAPKYSAGEVFMAISLAFFEKPGRKLAEAFELYRVLEMAGMNVHPVKYGAVTLSLTLLSTIIALVTYITLTLTKTLTPVERAIGLLLVLIVPMLILSIRLATPRIKAASRKNNVENELPFFMAYTTTMVRGGYTLEKVVERISHLRVFKGIRSEGRRVITRVKVFGEDPITAMEKVVNYHPSTRFRDIILGYTTTLRSGGDVTHYLEVRTREVFEHRMAEIKTIASRILSLLEVYMIFGVIVSLTLFVFFTVSAVITAAQAARMPEELREINIDLTLPIIYNFLVLPVMGVIVSIVVDVIQPKTPFSYLDIYATLFVSVPISLVVFVIVIVLADATEIFAYTVRPNNVKWLVYALFFSLTTASIVPAVKYWRVSKRHKGLIKSTASFLRDICEVRKTGLSPEKCIILVSHRDYKNLTPIVQRIATSLQLGVSLEEALKASIRGLKEWFVITSMRFLLDSISVGGGSPEVLDTLARFVQILGELEEETRRRLKSQIVLPYLGAALMAFSPLVLLYMLTSLARIPIAVMTPLVLALSLGSLINSYIMGLVAGKTTESTLAAGFRHAILLSAATTLTLTVTFAYIGL